MANLTRERYWEHLTDTEVFRSFVLSPQGEIKPVRGQRKAPPYRVKGYHDSLPRSFQAPRKLLSNTYKAR
jgi:hypothetical protein